MMKKKTMVTTMTMTMMGHDHNKQKPTNLQFPSSRITRLMDHPWPSSSTCHKSVVGSCHRKQLTKTGWYMGPTKLNQHLTFDPYSGLLAGACLVQTSDIVAIHGGMTRGPRHPSPQVCFLACNKEPLLNPHWVSDHSGCKPSWYWSWKRKTGYLLGTRYMVYVFGCFWIYLYHMYYGDALKTPNLNDVGFLQKKSNSFLGPRKGIWGVLQRSDNSRRNKKYTPWH